MDAQTAPTAPTAPTDAFISRPPQCAENPLYARVFAAYSAAGGGRLGTRAALAVEGVKRVTVYAWIKRHNWAYYQTLANARALGPALEAPQNAAPPDVHGAPEFSAAPHPHPHPSTERAAYSAPGAAPAGAWGTPRPPDEPAPERAAEIAALRRSLAASIYAVVSAAGGMLEVLRGIAADESAPHAARIQAVKVYFGILAAYLPAPPEDARDAARGADARAPLLFIPPPDVHAARDTPDAAPEAEPEAVQL